MKVLEVVKIAISLEMEETDVQRKPLICLGAPSGTQQRSAQTFVLSVDAMIMDIAVEAQFLVSTHGDPPDVFLLK